MRLASNLSLTTGVYATNVPPFNPLRLFAEGGQPEERYAEPVQECPTRTSPSSSAIWPSIRFRPASRGSDDADVISQIEEERANLAELRPPARAADPAAADAEPHADRRGSRQQRHSRLRARDRHPLLRHRSPRRAGERHSMRRRRQSRLARSRSSRTSWLMAKRGENFEQVMRGIGVVPDQIRAMIAAFGGKIKTTALPDGQVLQVLYAPGPRPGDERQIMRLASDQRPARRPRSR